MIIDVSLPKASFQNGYARSQGESAYPNLWKGLIRAFPTSLGQTGLTTLFDFSPYRKHGTFNATSNADWQYSQKGLVLDYDGANDRVGLGTGLMYGLTRFSVSAWIRSTDLTGNNGIFTCWPSAGNLSVLLRTSGANLQFFLYTTGQAGGTFTTVSTNTWYHVVCTYDGTTMRMYINGILDDTTFAQSGAIGQTDVATTIGGDASFSEGSWQGQIGDVFVWNREITATEAMQLYLGASPLTLRRRFFGAAGSAVVPAFARSFGFIIG